MKFIFKLQFQRLTSNPSERHRKLWEKLTHRGPQAFDKILEILREYRYIEALNILKPVSYRESVLSLSDIRHGTLDRTTRQDPPEPESPPVPAQSTSNGCANFDGNRISTSSKTFRLCTLSPHSEEVYFSDAKLKVKKCSSECKHTLLETYPMRSRNRGVLLLVNIINFVNKKDYRQGSENDSRDMIALFKEMGFTVFFYQDITAVDLRQIIQDLIKSEYLRKTDCFVLCVMSHGTINKDSLVTQIEFKDGSYESTENIVSKFANNECHLLVGKPKIFIFPVCRGDSPDREHYIVRGMGEIHTDGPTDYNAQQVSVSTFSDILICYATVPGYKVHRQTEVGSWYIQELVKIFALFAAEYPIEDLLKKIDFEVLRKRRNERYLQTASFENRGFNKALFFNPGYVQKS